MLPKAGLKLWQTSQEAFLCQEQLNEALPCYRAITTIYLHIQLAAV